MPKNLVIVESPAKAHTIEKYLGSDFKVLASVGHIRKDTKVDKSEFDALQRKVEEHLRKETKNKCEENNTMMKGINFDTDPDYLTFKASLAANKVTTTVKIKETLLHKHNINYHSKDILRFETFQQAIEYIKKLRFKSIVFSQYLMETFIYYFLLTLY